MKRMKQFVIAVMLLLPLATFAQIPPLDAGTGKYTYQEIPMAQKLSAKEIYEEAKKWGAAKGWEVVEDDAAENMIKWNAVAKVSYPSTKGGTNLTGDVKYTIRVDAKQGKYRIIATDFIHEEPRGSGGELEADRPACGINRILPKSWVDIKRGAHTQTKETLEDLKDTIREYENDPARNDNW